MNAHRKCSASPGTPEPPTHRLLCHNPDAVLADAEAGAELLTFNRATGLKLLQVHGRRPHVALLHRAADPAKPIPLESAIVSGVKVTTPAAVRRWIARCSHGRTSNAPAPTPQAETCRRQRTDARLDLFGIK